MSTISFDFFDVLPDDNGQLYPYPDKECHILAVVHGRYKHCAVITEQDSYEEGGRSYLIIIDDETEDAVEFSDINKWAYIEDNA